MGCPVNEGKSSVYPSWTGGLFCQLVNRDDVRWSSGKMRGPDVE